MTRTRVTRRLITALALLAATALTALHTTPATAADPITVSVGDATPIQEATGGNLAFPVTLSAPSDTDVTVLLSTRCGPCNRRPPEGMARANYDYNKIPRRTLTFTPGQTQKWVRVGVYDDNLDEIDEKVSFGIDSASVEIARKEASTVILDDDTVTLSIQDATGSEPTGVGTFRRVAITMTMSGRSSRDVTVTFSTEDDTAVAPGDYDAKTTQVVFPSFRSQGGPLTRSLNVLVRGDNIPEGTEQLFVHITDSSGPEIVDGDGVVTITGG